MDALKRVVMWSDGGVTGWDSKDQPVFRRNLFDEFLKGLRAEGGLIPGTLVEYRASQALNDPSLLRMQVER